eukprot:TRINITY_DN4083_c0_g4_i1.p1 TRINITY_DN4083_c0_g4~~TRINITY_DN4083_c0_g4_i1.p1  ORF type:complete len:465 (+),score=82.44 TRINITY_DN4083_c0_g4_i1:162-1556(+)
MQELIQFIELDKPTNIYGSCVFVHQARQKFLVASCCQVSCISATELKGEGIHFKSEEFSLPFKPNEHNIISIDAFQPTSISIPGSVPFGSYFYGVSGGKIGVASMALSQVIGRSSVVGICGVKKSQTQSTVTGYLSIHGYTSTQETSIARICNDFQLIELPYTPFFITHLPLSLPQGQGENGRGTTAFLIFGSDECVHMYLPTSHKGDYQELVILPYFPELTRPSPYNQSPLPTPSTSPVMKSEFAYLSQNGVRLRLCALGCQNGLVFLTIVDEDSKELVSGSHFMMDGPVSSLHFYSPPHPVKFFSPYAHSQIQLKEKSDNIHLLVCSTVGCAVVFCDVINKGLQQAPIPLPHSDGFDSITCSAITDFDLDGKLEILIGTYGQEVLVYKYIEDEHPNNNNTPKFIFHHQLSFPHPILSLTICDIANNNKEDFVVVTTMYGVNFLKPALKVEGEQKSDSETSPS